MAAGGEMVAAGLEPPEEELAEIPRSDHFFPPLVQLQQPVSLVSLKRSSLTDGERKMLRRVHWRRR